MSPATFQLRPAVSDQLADLARLLRRSCALREQGDAEGAALVRDGEFAKAVRDFRLQHGPAALPEEEIQRMLAEEEKRVAEAAIIAELLRPHLAEAGPREPSPSAVSVRPPVSPAAPPPRAVAAGSPAIPDLLDAMLAAERPSRRPAPAPPRQS